MAFNYSNKNVYLAKIYHLNLTNVKKGFLLIAELALTGDVSFSRSIIFLVEHNQEGSVGFVLNKKTEYKLSDLLPDIKNDFDLFNGGPVDQDNLYYIHKIPDIIPKSHQITDTLFWGGDFNILLSELQAGHISEDDIKFFLGYSGWAPTQLSFEIENDSWIVIENNTDILKIESTSFWKEELKKLGGKYLIWANSPEDPNLN